MILALRILLSIPLWLLRVALLLVLAIIGIPIIWVLAQQGMCWPTKSKRFNRTVLQFAPFFSLWGNDEDGVDGLRGGDPAQQWWADQTAGWSPQKRIFRWSAFRNPVDSLRWLPIINPVIDPARVRYVGSMDREPQDGESGWYFAWQGLYSCIRWEFAVRGRFYRIWIGNKLKPEDRLGIADSDIRKIRCDFAAQVKRVQ